MDRFQLQCEMKRNGYTVERFCKELGMTKVTFYRKCKGIGNSDFSRGEIEKICNMLGLDSPVGIFFTSEVS